VSGFLSLQALVDSYAINPPATNSTQSPAERQADIFNSISTGGLMATPMPTGAYSSNPFYAGVGPMFGLLLTMGTLYPISELIRSVVQEKEERQEEMKHNHK